YELLTARPPFDGLTMRETLEQVRSREPIRPRSLNPNVPPELDIICLKCLEKQPEGRYASAVDLAEDLRRFLANEPILARPASAWERLRKWARRRPAAVALLLVSGMAVLSLLLLAVWHKVEVQNTVEQTRAGEIQALEHAHTKFDEFQQSRDDALFYGIYGTLLPDFDRTNKLEAMEAAARRALGLVNLELESDAPLMPDAYWSEEQKSEVVRGCYELLLLLSDAAAQPRELGPQPGRDHIRRALALLH